MYKIIDAATATSHAINVAFDKNRISHLIITGLMTSATVAELNKIKLNIMLVPQNRPICSNVLLGDMLNVNKKSGGLGLATNDWFLKIPIGDVELKNEKLLIDVNTTATITTSTIRMWGMRESDRLPIYEYQYRNITTDGVTFENVAELYDVASAYNDTTESLIEFQGGSSMVVPHSIGYAKMQCKTQLAVAASEIFFDKDGYPGRSLKIRPSAAFDALVKCVSPLSIFK